MKRLFFALITALAVASPSYAAAYSSKTTTLKNNLQITGNLLFKTANPVTIVPTNPAAASTDTIPDAGAAASFVLLSTPQTTAGQLKRADLSIEALDRFPIPLQSCRNNDGTALDATGGAGKFKIVNGGVGVGTLNLTSEAAQSNTKTDTISTEVALLDEYVAGGNISIDVNCQTVGAGTLTTKTLTLTMWKLNGDGTATSVPLTNGVITFTGAAALSTASVTTPAGFNPGDRFIIYAQSILTETGAVSTTAQINRLDFKYDVKG